MQKNTYVSPFTFKKQYLLFLIMFTCEGISYISNNKAKLTNSELHSDGEKKSLVTKSKDVLNNIGSEVKSTFADVTGNTSIEIKLDYLTKMMEIMFIICPFFIINILIVIIAPGSLTLPLLITNFIMATLVILRLMDKYSLNGFIMRKSTSKNNNYSQEVEKQKKKQELLAQANKINPKNLTLSNELSINSDE